MRRDLAVVPEGTTEDKLIELWVRLKKSPHTQRAYQRDVQFFRDFVEKPLAAVTLEDALDFTEAGFLRLPLGRGDEAFTCSLLQVKVQPLTPVLSCSNGEKL